MNIANALYTQLGAGTFTYIVGTFAFLAVLSHNLKSLRLRYYFFGNSPDLP